MIKDNFLDVNPPESGSRPPCDNSWVRHLFCLGCLCLPASYLPGSAPCVPVIVIVDEEKFTPRLGASWVQQPGHWQPPGSGPIGPPVRNWEARMGLKLASHIDDLLPSGCLSAYSQSAARLPIVSLAACLPIVSLKGLELHCACGPKGYERIKWDT